jgi:hypothetical protein
MSEQTQLPVGDLLYEYTPMITQLVEYGASFEPLASRQTPPPAEGARFDVYSRALLPGPSSADR